MFVLFAVGLAIAQDGYQQPSQVISDILDAQYPPGVQLSPDGNWTVELERRSLRTLEELAAPRVKVAGIKLDPQTFGPSRPYLFRRAVVRGVSKRGATKGKRVLLPDDASIAGVDWHPDSDKFVLTVNEPQGISLWLVTPKNARAVRLTDAVLNRTYGAPCDWLPADQGLICKRRPDSLGAAPVANPVPEGPRIEENLGRKTPARTYSNLLQSPHDEALFTHYLTSELVHVGLDGSSKSVFKAALISAATPSPDGQWLMVRTLEEPFSYQVPASRFPMRTVVVPIGGGVPVEVASLPLADDIPVPFSSVRTGRREVGWRDDVNATLYMVEALDGGDSGKEAEVRDRVSLLPAPFRGKPSMLWESPLRFDNVSWGNDTTALASEWWYDTRQVRTWVIDPSGKAKPRMIWDRSYQDQYSDPGTPVGHIGPLGTRVLRFTSDGGLLLSGKGASDKGVYPFLDHFDLTTGKSERLWQAKDPYYERLTKVLAGDGERIVTRRQSQTEPPNYWIRDFTEKGKTVPLTEFEDWAPQFAAVTKELIEYERADGLPLSATLYLPPGYDKAKHGRLPTVFWAYPSEFKNKGDAGQKTTSDNTFSRPYGSSVLMMLLAGYAVVDNPTIPIVGEGEQQPNDTYVSQLIMGAEAAVKAVTGLKVADPDRLIIGGHSYGAFTAANLLAHTDFFAAGIARSGAYNRSLTPFGFQSEQRTYWEALPTYVEMSPFTHVAKIDEPLLMIHGAEDPNSGTYPMQSKRMYSAMKGNGGTVRWVELPLEEHGYSARESIGHVLWEMIRWADTHAADD
jgi:dipeptidyl aminopeptidase/acylaminoacyl peptidase